MCVVTCACVCACVWCSFTQVTSLHPLWATVGMEGIGTTWEWGRMSKEWDKKNTEDGDENGIERN